MLARQAPLDGSLRLVQPVQRPVQVVHRALAHAEGAPQRAGGRVVVQRAVRGQLGGGLEHARHEHGLQQRLQLLRGRAEPLRRPRAARRTQHCSDMSVRQRPLDAQHRQSRLDRHAALEQHAKVLDEPWIPVRQVGQRALDDLAAFSIALAQQDGRG